MFRKCGLLLLSFNLLVDVNGAPQGSIDGPPEPFNYNYRVANPPTNTFFGHSENGDAVGRVTGTYYVNLPDGRIMTVEYFVDGDSGYVPKISFQQSAPLSGVPA
ncbi:hypothetical protein WA026_001689 [Henosepilachna vigintioctopunctata]|uniref:Cuticle protein n=1 Tax=Henosepilachna vigintioctopunctata TaxID=420089 RepID=A0AAW1UQN2_9CUCU